MNTESNPSTEAASLASVPINEFESQMFKYLRLMAEEMSNATGIQYASISVEITRTSIGSFEQTATAYLDGSGHLKADSVRAAVDRQVIEFRPIRVKNLRDEAARLLKEASTLELKS